MENGIKKNNTSVEYVAMTHFTASYHAVCHTTPTDQKSLVLCGTYAMTFTFIFKRDTFLDKREVARTVRSECGKDLVPERHNFCAHLVLKTRSAYERKCVMQLTEAVELLGWIVENEIWRVAKFFRLHTEGW